MPALTTVAFFAIATLLLTVTPGPGVLYVTARTVAQGRRAGIVSMFAIEAGEVVWLVAAATGVAAVISASTATLTVLRFAGAAYLIFLGVQRWRAAGSLETAPPARHGRTFAQGFVTQILNPKVAVFFVAFFPQFIDPARPLAPQVAVLGAVYVAIAMAVDATYVITSAAVARRLLADRGARRRTGQVAAATYFALGVAAAATGVRHA